MFLVDLMVLSTYGALTGIQSPKSHSAFRVLLGREATMHVQGLGPKIVAAVFHYVYGLCTPGPPAASLVAFNRRMRSDGL